MSRLDELKSRLPHPDYYSEDFRVTLDSCIDYIRNHPATTVVDVDPHHARIYEGDFYTYLLTTIRVPKESHWIIARINGMLCSSDFHRGMKTLIVPSQQVISNMRTSVRTVQTLDDF